MDKKRNRFLIKYEVDDDISALVVYYIMTQNILKKGLKVFRNHGEEAVQKELIQLHMLNAFCPLGAEKLTKEEMAKAIVSLS